MPSTPLVPSTRVLLYQLDGKLPNLALMRLAAHHKALGDQVSLRVAGNVNAIRPEPSDLVYASAIFRRTLPVAEALLRAYPHAILGGTGVDPARPGELLPLSPAIQPAPTSLVSLGVSDGPLDYSLYPLFRSSIGFTQRGCRLSCEFCVVPTKEGKVREVATVHDIWRGEGHPREILLLDNDFFGQPNWRDRVRELREGRFKVSFNQGINARCLTEEAAEAIGSLDYRDDSMKVRRVYTAWDNRADEDRLMTGLARLTRYGVKPDNIMVYMLIGYWPGETSQDREYRRARLREFGARPYPMPFTRTQELVGFQRWVIGAYDKRVSWARWERANYRPEKLDKVDASVLPLAV